MAAALDTAPDAMVEWVNDLLGSAAPRARAAAAVANPRPALKAFAQRLTFSLRVPGAHPDGLAYDELLGILAAQGRDFAADSAKLRTHVANALVEQFGDDRRPPGVTQLRQIAAAAILEWVLLRLESQLRDVPIKPNDPAYRAWKKRFAAYSAVGMRSGALRNALRDKGRVTVR